MKKIFLLLAIVSILVAIYSFSTVGAFQGIVSLVALALSIFGYRSTSNCGDSKSCKLYKKRQAENEGVQSDEAEVEEKDLK